MSEVNLKGRKVTVHDMCLRDGMHAKREQMSIEQMVTIATALDEAGVPYIQVTHGAGLGGNSLQHGFAPHSNEAYLAAVCGAVKQTKVSVLQVHGDKDTNVAYDGTPFTPSAHQTVAIWADRNACTGLLTNGGIRLDIEAGLAGAETRVEAYAGCRNDGSVELWTIEGGGHIPNFNSQWPGAIYDFLMAHPKP